MAEHKHLLSGTVISSVRDQTITVLVDRLVKHPRLGKVMRRRTKYQVHDPKNDAKTGDKVQFQECRPISKTKHWHLIQILEQAAS